MTRTNDMFHKQSSADLGARATKVKIREDKMRYEKPKLISLNEHLKTTEGACGSGSGDFACSSGSGANSCNGNGSSATIGCYSGPSAKTTCIAGAGKT